jgi:hypothetical protein
LSGAYRYFIAFLLGFQSCQILKTLKGLAREIAAGLYTLSFLLSVIHHLQSEIPKEKDVITIPKPKVQIKNQK